MKDDNNNSKEEPEKRSGGKIVRAGMQIVGGVVPFAGGLLSAAAGAWSEREQEKVNGFLKHWLEMLQEEISEKEQTILEIAARLDMHDKAVAERVASVEYQSLIKKAFRDWAAVESVEKRVYVRNILANAAATRVVSDDVARLFLEWLSKYSEMHFQVISAVYNSNGITRGEIWRKIGKGEVREDSADADLFKLLISDLNIGRVIRQHREVDFQGNFVPKIPQRRPKGSGPKPMVSAFDENEKYELTGLGQQFVHYAMTDLPMKIEYAPNGEDPK